MKVHCTEIEQSRHVTIYGEFKIKPIIEIIQTDQLRWFGHVMRRDENTIDMPEIELFDYLPCYKNIGKCFYTSEEGEHNPIHHPFHLEPTNSSKHYMVLTS